jgi:hypothetical protein
MTTIAIIDADPIIYAAASVGEERYIEVTHSPSGRVNEFKNKTTFYGKSKKRDGGWLGELNAERAKSDKNPFLLEDFEIVEKQRVKEKIENVLHTAKMMVAGSIQTVEAESMVCFVGGSAELIRLQQSTLMEYKGKRKDSLKPLLKEEVTDYIIKHQNGILCNDGHEADDWVIIEALRVNKSGDTAIVSTIDKDVLGCPVLSYNPDKPEMGIQNGDCFGELSLDDKQDVRGIGRIFKYYQVIYGDKVDCYHAHAQSDVRWGEKSAYNALKDVQNDRDAWKVMYDVYNHLYPEQKIITTWRGDEITIDALYCMQEVWNMAHMRRFENDVVDIKEVLKKYKII